MERVDRHHLPPRKGLPIDKRVAGSLLVAGALFTLSVTGAHADAARALHSSQEHFPIRAAVSTSVKHQGISDFVRGNAVPHSIALDKVILSKDRILTIAPAPQQK